MSSLVCETTVESPNPRLRCEMCKEGPAKYKCPRCFLQTCCLACVKEHKVALQCNGLRDKTAYVNMKSFTDMHLLSDYRLLEDTGRRAESACRDPLKQRRDRPWHVNRLIHQARLRGVQLRVLPYPSTKRKQNKSYYNNKTKRLSWHVEWTFPELAATYTDKIPEEDSLQTALVHLLESPGVGAVERQRLKAYTERATGNMRLLMKVEGRRANSLRYHALDGEKSLKDNLAGKDLVEYPTIHVVTSTGKGSYTVLKPDGTDETESSTDDQSSDSMSDGDVSSSAASVNEQSALEPTGGTRQLSADDNVNTGTETVIAESVHTAALNKEASPGDVDGS